MSENKKAILWALAGIGLYLMVDGLLARAQGIVEAWHPAPVQVDPADVNPEARP